MGDDLAAFPVRSMRPVDLGAPLSLNDFAAVAEGRAQAVLGPGAEDRLARGLAALGRCLDENRLVYGVTTGFGPLARHILPVSDIETLQRNLICHLASGVGDPLPGAEARGLMLARLASMTQGWSGASPELARMMCDCLNAGLAPEVPEKGTVGASGDLTPSAHMALALMGEGAFRDAQGNRLAGVAGPARADHAPWTLRHRDGLALVNGTSAMTAVAALNAARMGRALAWSERLSALFAEVTSGRQEAWDPAFARARPHPGQIAATEALNAAIAGSGRIDRGRAAATRLDPLAGPEAREAAHQDPYSTRCAPQILGAVRDVMAFHDAVVLRELNAATDNPIFSGDDPGALHGGNFYGQHVAFAADALTPAAIKLAILAERQLARLVDPARNGGLPAFLAGAEAGLNSGFMGAQVTASALVAEMRCLAIPASIQSISTNGDNQDVVSLGTIAARKCRAALIEVARVLAIHALALAQAVDLLAARGLAGFSPAGLALHAEIRSIAPPLVSDRPLAGEIARMAERIAEAAPAGVGTSGAGPVPG